MDEPITYGARVAKQICEELKLPVIVKSGSEDGGLYSSVLWVILPAKHLTLSVHTHTATCGDSFCETALLCTKDNAKAVMDTSHSWLGYEDDVRRFRDPEAFRKHLTHLITRLKNSGNTSHT